MPVAASRNHENGHILDPQRRHAIHLCGTGERWKDGTLSFTIPTTEASAVTLDLHDRIPVILDQRGFSEWLDEGAVAARIDLGEQVHLIPVSLKMHNSKYHAEDCIIPLTEPPDAPSWAVSEEFALERVAATS